MNIGGTLVPRHLFFSRDWVVKLQSTELMDLGLHAEEEKFMANFTHAAQISEIASGAVPTQVWGLNIASFSIGYPRL